MADIFGIKRRKAIKQKKLDEIKQLKEREARRSIRTTLNSMKRQVLKFEGYKNEYIDKARKATLINNKESYNFAKNGIKLCLSKQRFLESMLSNFEMALQTNEMSKIIVEFSKGMNIISEQMSEISSGIDIDKAKNAYASAIANSGSQYEALDAFLKEATDSIDSFSDADIDISDEEIDNLINDQAAQSETNFDDDIDKKISSIRNSMNTY